MSVVGCDVSRTRSVPRRPPSLLDLGTSQVAGPDIAASEVVPPAFFPDVGLDHVVERVLAGSGRDALEPLFYRRLASREAVAYRQDVFRDLDGWPLLEQLRDFGARMTALRRDLDLAPRMRLGLQREGTFLSAARAYCHAVHALAGDLAGAGLRSAGLRGVLAFLDEYVASPGFARLDQESGEVERALGEIVYCLDVGHRSVRVTRFEGQADVAERIERTFGRFRHDRLAEAKAPRGSALDLDQVEAAIVTRVAALFPQPFAALADFCRVHQGFLNPGVCGIEREAAFYLAYLDAIRPLRRAGLAFCYPRVSRGKEVHVEGAFDLSLAMEAVAAGRRVVPNDVMLQGDERVLVVTGPNQGGKTTFARMVAQLHHLGALGCPVPGTAARLVLPDRIFTHFDRQENLQDLRGKLEDDLVRVRDLLREATSESILVANELFASTSPTDALALGRRIIEEIIERDLLAVYVTFVDELASFTPQVVSMTATVEPDDPRIRTYRVMRRRPDGRAYATAIARRYGLDRETLRERLAR